MVMVVMIIMVFKIWWWGVEDGWVYDDMVVIVVILIVLVIGWWWKWLFMMICSWWNDNENKYDSITMLRAMFLFKVQLTIFLVFISNVLSYNFKHFCKNVFVLDQLFFFLKYFETREISSILVYGRALKEAGNSREWRHFYPKFT